MNKKLLIVIVVLLPIAVISFFTTEANFILPKEEEKKIIEENITVRLKLSSSNEIVEISLEDYIIGVVAAEMPASFHEEAIKAQAIAARSYAYSKLENILTDTVSNQAYIDTSEMKTKWGTSFEEYYKKIKGCVNKTKDMIVTYNGNPVTTYYFAMSNGHTEDSELVFQESKPYLKSVESTWDNEKLNNYKVELRLSKSEFCKKLDIECKEISISNIKKSDSNRVLTLKVNNNDFKGTDFRTKLGLRSTDFEISVTNEYVYITTYGYGHGVGMSQYGANGMASEGATYEEIIKYYYQNTEINNLNNV